MSENTKDAKTLLDNLKVREKTVIDEYKKEIAKTIADTFHNWKERDKSITQTTFAKLIGCSQPRVSNIIKGNVDQFTVDKLLGFCINLNMNPVLQTKPLKNLKSDTREILDHITEEDAA